MVNVIFEDASEFMSLMDIVSNLVEEANLVFDDDGVTMRSMDPSRVALIDFSIPSNSFEEYKPELASSDDRGVSLGLGVERFYKFLSRGSKNDSLRLKTISDDSVLKIYLDNDRRRKSFRLPLRDIGGDEQDFPTLNHSAEASINAGIVKDALRDAALVDDSLTFDASEGDKIKLGAGSGNQSSSAVIREGELLSDVSIDEDSVATYALSYLESFFKGLGKGDEVMISLGSDMPLLISRDLYEGNLRFVLAPRIDDGD